MEDLYDWLVQQLTSAPMVVQVIVLLAVALPACAAAAWLLLAAFDAAAGFAGRARDRRAASRKADRRGEGARG